MDAKDKETALRMIPYGLYVLTARAADGRIATATVNWVTQSSFAPPLVVVGVKVDSGAHQIIKEAQSFALNILGKDQVGAAYAFFKPVEPADGTIGGEPFRDGSTGSPILESVPAYVECKLVDTVEGGDHSVMVGEVVDAGVSQPPEGRPDEHTLTLKDLGEKLFYGG
ncbi:MAG: flavin reductase family protein [Lentisphaeria bacterium]|jgi:flavin reductase (DIM6/NTAB) family NADH-FMN oxidoreductase RutF|nr:flavin reductase family protein [Lentisphaeria bacterium]